MITLNYIGSYLIRGTLTKGLCFTAYTYAGELPSCAFGFNCKGLVCGPNKKKNVNQTSVINLIWLWIKLLTYIVQIIYLSGVYIEFGSTYWRRNFSWWHWKELYLSRSSWSDNHGWCLECKIYIYSSPSDSYEITKTNFWLLNIDRGFVHHKYQWDIVIIWSTWELAVFWM